MTDLGLSVVDADTHLTEPHDLWTRRAPRRYRDRVPLVADVDGQPTWVVDGTPLQRASASSVVHRDGSRCLGTAFIGWTFDDAHPAAYDVPARLQVMDEVGVWAQIVYPNAAGFGGQRFGTVGDPLLKNLCATLYNDAMCELQTEGGGRLFPMALLPWWDVAASVAEAQRAASLGLRGVNMTSDPQQGGAPDLGQQGVGSAMGGLRGSRLAGELSHRSERDQPRLVRHFSMAVAGRRTRSSPSAPR